MRTFIVPMVCLSCLFPYATASTFAQAQAGNAVGQDSSDASAAQKKAAEIQKTMRSLGFSMSFFYRNPDAAQFDRISKLIDEHEETILKASKRNRFNVIAATFLARVHQKHEFPISSTGKIGDLARAIIAKDKDNQEAVFVNDPKQITASKLDAWWISFSATGDTKYVESILKVTGNPRTKKVNGLLSIPVVTAANWSFKSNCRLHKPVFEFAANASKLEKWAAQKSFLDHCVAFVKEAQTQKETGKAKPKP